MVSVRFLGKQIWAVAAPRRDHVPVTFLLLFTLLTNSLLVFINYVFGYNEGRFYIEAGRDHLPLDLS